MTLQERERRRTFRKGFPLFILVFDQPQAPRKLSQLIIAIYWRLLALFAFVGVFISRATAQQPHTSSLILC